MHTHRWEDGFNGVTLIDLSNPLQPTVLSQLMAAALGEGVENAWIEGSSGAYDVYVRDGLAFVSHWDAGLVILDVGNGIAGGSPTNPVEVSRVQTEGGKHQQRLVLAGRGGVLRTDCSGQGDGRGSRGGPICPGERSATP